MVIAPCRPSWVWECWWSALGVTSLIPKWATAGWRKPARSCGRVICTFSIIVMVLLILVFVGEELLVYLCTKQKPTLSFVQYSNQVLHLLEPHDA